MKRQKSLNVRRRGGAARALALAALASIGVPAVGQASDANQTRFDLHPNPQFVRCLAAYPDDATRPPQATVTVKRGNLNDQLSIQLKNIKPGLAFDLFTVERSSLLADGTVDPEAKNKGFGLAWYQTDLEVENNHRNETTIRTVLLDQIFGFDPAVGLAPTNTFHVGFWFNAPEDAADCGFTGFTPFNGEHQAGPLAMISVPDPATELGPLCLNPDLSSDPVKCNP
jgi:hypothetical protein